MEHKGALPRLLGAELRRSLTVRSLLVPVGVVLCICLDTWNQIPFMWTSPETMDVYYSQSRRFWHVTILYCTTLFSFAVVRQSLLYGTEARACLFLSLCVFVKFRLTIFLNAGQRSIPGGIRVGKVTDCINVNGSVCAPQEAH